MTRKRFLEILPGFITWNVILFLFWGGYFIPVATAYFILAFDIFWVYKGLTVTITVLMTHFKMLAAEHLDWLREAKGFLDWKRVKHVIIILIANEPAEVYRKTLEALAKQSMPLNQLAVVMATEGRYPNGEKECEKLRAELGSKFGEYLITMHPANIVGEIKGKSSNEAWAAREAKRILIDEKGWDIQYMTVTSNDADARLHPQYFACLTFKFLDDPHRYERFWQPVVMFYNNIWRLPAATRVVNTFATIWVMGLQSRKDRLVSFSCYSASFRLILEVGYWDTDVIPEDYRIFFKAFFKLEGRVEAEPIFLPSFQDAAESTTTWKTFVNDYKQKQRWAWGVSDIPTFIEMFINNPKGPWINKMVRLLRVIEDHLLWPINWFVITAGATISTLVNPKFARTSVGFMLPRISSVILSITLLFLVILFVIDSKRKPPRPKDVAFWRAWLIPFEFALMPVVGFFFGALPGLDAHTRLMLGRYIEYRVTEKVG